MVEHTHEEAEGDFAGGLSHRPEGTPSPSAARARADEMLELLDLGDVKDKQSNDLSGGQKQRVAIGRSLMNSPDIVLADEPTGNLDTKNTEQVYSLFRRLREEWGTTFVIVTHHRSIAEQTDRIVEVRDDRIEQDVRNEHLASPESRPRAS